MDSLIKKAFGFLLHPTALRTNILVFLIILVLIPITVIFAGQPQTTQQHAAVKISPSPTPDKNPPSPQPQNSILFYIEPFIINSIKRTNASYRPKDRNVTF